MIGDVFLSRPFEYREHLDFCSKLVTVAQSALPHEP